MNIPTQQSSQIIVPRPYLHVLVFVQTIITIIFQIITITLMSRVLIYRFSMSNRIQSRNLSPMVAIYMIVHIVGSIICLPYRFYLVIFWKPKIPVISIDEPLYNPHIFVWTGIPEGIHLYTAAVPVFFLTLDRCLVLKFPLQYRGNSKRKLPIIAAVVTITWAVIIVLGFFPEFPFDMEKVKYCQSATCINTKLKGAPQLYMKIFMAIMNVVCAAYFFSALYTFKSLTGEKSRLAVKNRIVIVTTVSEIILNDLPILLTIVSIVTGNVSLPNIVGNNTMLLFTLDAVICSIFYTRVYLKKVPKSVNVVQSPLVSLVQPQKQAGSL